MNFSFLTQISEEMFAGASPSTRRQRQRDDTGGMADHTGGRRPRPCARGARSARPPDPAHGATPTRSVSLCCKVMVDSWVYLQLYETVHYSVPLRIGDVSLFCA